MIAGPEVALAVTEFETSCSHPTRAVSHLHHEQNLSTQKNYVKDVQACIDAIREMGNPFREDSGELLVLDTKEVIGAGVVATVKNIQKVSVPSKIMCCLFFIHHV